MCISFSKVKVVLRFYRREDVKVLRSVDLKTRTTKQHSKVIWTSVKVFKQRGIIARVSWNGKKAINTHTEIERDETLLRHHHVL